MIQAWRGVGGLVSGVEWLSLVLNWKKKLARAADTLQSRPLRQICARCGSEGM